MTTVLGDLLNYVDFEKKSLLSEYLCHSIDFFFG